MFSYMKLNWKISLLMAGFALRQNMTGVQIAQDVEALKYLESQQENVMSHSAANMTKATA